MGAPELRPQCADCQPVLFMFTSLPRGGPPEAYSMKKTHFTLGDIFKPFITLKILLELKANMTKFRL